MSDSENDEDLKRAIALSLQDVGPGASVKPKLKPKPVIIDLVSSDETEDDIDAPVKRRVPRATSASGKRYRPVETLPKVEPNSQAKHVKPENEEYDLESQDKMQSLDAPESPTLLDLLSSAQRSSTLNPFQSIESSLHVEEQPSKLAVPSYVTREISSPPTNGPAPSRVSTSSSGILQRLNRKEMEEDRLMRVNRRKKREETTEVVANELRKRKASVSPSSTPGPVLREAKKAATFKSFEVETNLATRLNGSALSEQSSIDKNVVSYSGQQTLLGASGVQFPDGVVKKTWAHGCPRENDIKIEEVFQKDTLKLAVLSAFQIMPEWVASKLKPQTKVIWVLQAKTDAEKENFRSDAPDNYRFCFPSMKGQINCMHSKLQLLAHDTHLRIVVPSANLVPYDWGETGVMENVVFIIDLPRLPAGQITEFDKLTDFGRELLHFLDAQGLNDKDGWKLATSIKKFDFSRTSHLAFVHSIGGSHSGNNWRRTGFGGLGTAIKNLGMDTNGAINCNFVTSSVGSLTNSFIKIIYMAAQGGDGLKDLESRIGLSIRESSPLGLTINLMLTRHLQEKQTKEAVAEAEDRKLSEDIDNGFRIYFPTRETVAQSKGGIGAGGTICFQAKWFDAATFPKHLMRDCKSVRPGMLMHSKMLLCSSNQTPLGKNISWAYVGSANLSESAWGTLVKDKNTKLPKLNVRNWECGVVVPADKVPMPVPMVVLGDVYGERRPWFFTEA